MDFLVPGTTLGRDESNTIQEFPCIYYLRSTCLETCKEWALDEGSVKINKVHLPIASCANKCQLAQTQITGTKLLQIM